MSALAFARLQLRCSLRGEGAAPACWRPPPPARPRAPPLGGHPMTSVWRGSCEPLSHGGGAHARIPAAVCTWTRTRLTYMLAPHVVPLPLCAVCVLPPASLISLSRMRRPSTSIERMRSSSPTACRASLTAATGVPGTASSGGTLGMVPLVSGHRTGWGVKKEGERWGRAGGRRKEGGGVCSGALVSELIPSTAETRVHCLTFPYRGDAPCFSLPVLVPWSPWSLRAVPLVLLLLTLGPPDGHHSHYATKVCHEPGGYLYFYINGEGVLLFKALRDMPQ